MSSPRLQRFSIPSQAGAFNFAPAALQGGDEDGLRDPTGERRPTLPVASRTTIWLVFQRPAKHRAGARSVPRWAGSPRLDAGGSWSAAVKPQPLPPAATPVPASPAGVYRGARAPVLQPGYSCLNSRFRLSRSFTPGCQSGCCRGAPTCVSHPPRDMNGSSFRQPGIGQCASTHASTAASNASSTVNLCNAAAFLHRFQSWSEISTVLFAIYLLPSGCAPPEQRRRYQVPPLLGPSDHDALACGFGC